MYIPIREFKFKLKAKYHLNESLYGMWAVYKQKIKV